MKSVAVAASAFASANEHAISIREKGVSCRELTELYIERIHKHNPALHAIVISNEADAIRTACERDDDLTNDIVRGPLHGVPVTVKESFNLTGVKTTVNFPQLKNNIAAIDALIVRRLKGATADPPAGLSTVVQRTLRRAVSVTVACSRPGCCILDTGRGGNKGRDNLEIT